MTKVQSREKRDPCEGMRILDGGFGPARDGGVRTVDVVLLRGNLGDRQDREREIIKRRK